jgi:cytoskeleton protein RodZ
MPEIGATLREARMHARIDVSEIEAQTKIRAKYLRALENEEWSLLPGPTFVKSFLRTYAQALGLDAKALVEEYRLHHEGVGEPFEPIVSAPHRARSGSSSRAPRAARPGRAGGSRSGPSRGYVVAVSVIGAVIVLLVVLLATGGGGGSNKSPAASTTARKTKHHTSSSSTAHTHTATSPIVALSLKATAAVYVCLVGDRGRILVHGVELQPGESTSTFHDRRYELRLGNSSVTMYIDGRPRTVPPSSEPIGYSITHARGRQPLSAAHMPTCE